MAEVSSNIFGILLLVICIIVIGWSLLSTGVGGDNIITIDPQKAMAFAVSPPIFKEGPIYIANDRTTSNNSIIIDGGIHAILATFSGYGNAKDINFTDSGKGFTIPRGNNGVINIQGHATIVSTNGGKASLAFEEIGHPSGVNGTITASGAAFFDANATGNLSFLSNVVAVFRDTIYKDGTDKVTAWEWK